MIRSQAHRLVDHMLASAHLTLKTSPDRNAASESWKASILYAHLITTDRVPVCTCVPAWLRLRLQSNFTYPHTFFGSVGKAEEKGENTETERLTDKVVVVETLPLSSAPVSK